jgi:hypothetical protein
VRYALTVRQAAGTYEGTTGCLASSARPHEEPSSARARRSRQAIFARNIWKAACTKTLTRIACTVSILAQVDPAKSFAHDKRHNFAQEVAVSVVEAATAGWQLRHRFTIKSIPEIRPSQRFADFLRDVQAVGFIEDARAGRLRGLRVGGCGERDRQQAAEEGEPDRFHGLHFFFLLLAPTLQVRAQSPCPFFLLPQRSSESHPAHPPID